MLAGVRQWQHNMLGWAGLGWLGWAGLAGLGWAGLGWAGLGRVAMFIVFMNLVINVSGGGRVITDTGLMLVMPDNGTAQ